MDDELEDDFDVDTVKFAGLVTPSRFERWQRAAETAELPLGEWVLQVLHQAAEADERASVLAASSHQA